MANGFVTAGGGGGAVILRAVGDQGTKVTATLGTKTKTGEIGSDGALQLKLPGLGLWKVKAEKGAYSSEQNVKLYRYGITEHLTAVKKSFHDCTVDEIKFVLRNKLWRDWWQVGDEHDIEMSDGEIITVQILDFEHDYAPNNVFKLPITLGMKDCFKQKYAMHENTTRSIGWSACSFRNVTVPSILQKFPVEWQDIILKSKKKSNVYSGGTLITTTDDSLFLFSTIELFGQTYTFDGGRGVTPSGTGDQYSFFADNASRVKNFDGTPTQYGLRDTNVGSQGNEMMDWVSCASTGAGPYPYGALSTAIALGFCIGDKEDDRYV